jgi:hypothetical protein
MMIQNVVKPAKENARHRQVRANINLERGLAVARFNN